MGRSTRGNFVVAIRRADESALREFFIYFQPVLLDHARRLGIPPGNADEIVMTFLDDKVTELVKMDIEPASLAGYVIRSFRNRVFNIRRDERTRDVIYDDAMTSIGAQRIVAECHSEYGLHAATSPSDSAPFLRPALLKLSEYSAAQLTTDEIGLVMALGDRVPMREIADWLGITYANCRVKAHRLRGRIAKLALQYMNELEPAEREEVQRFLKRAATSERRVENV